MNRLLLVDDAPDIALLAKGLARRTGVPLTHAPDLASAWAELCKEPPDLVLLDLHLGAEDGLDLLRRARLAPDLERVPFALLGHLDSPEDVAAALQAGVDYVIPKETICRWEEWQARVTEILEMEQGRATRPAHPTENAAAAARRLQTALRHPSLTALGRPVLHELLRRALNRLDRAAEGQPLPNPDDILDATASVPERLAPSLNAALAEQVWRVLGTAGGAAAFPR